MRKPPSLLRVLTLTLLLTGIGTICPAGASLALTDDPEETQAGGGLGQPGAFLSAAVAIGGLLVDGNDVDNGVSSGVDVRGGYRISEWLAVDVGFEWLRHRTSLIDATSRSDVTGDTWAVTSDLRVYLARWGNGEFYLSGGLGAVGDEGLDGTDGAYFALRYGGGLDVYLTEHVGLNLSLAYLLPTAELDLDYVAGRAGIFYKF